MIVFMTRSTSPLLILIHNLELGDSTDAAQAVVDEIKQMGGEAMAIHASVEEADAIIDQIIGTVTIVI